MFVDLDEFDVVAKLRDDKNELGELKRVVNSLIQNIDSLDNNSVLIAATNHHELLDPAIWRRFSKVITLEKPHKEEIAKLLNIFLANSSNNILDNDKKFEQMETAFEGFSHAGIRTVITNTMRNSIIREKSTVTACDVLREIYFYKKHSIEDEDAFIRFLLQNNATHKEINENLGIPLRRIQTVSKGRGEINAG
jgi:AAA+ superfamily predicted ATPase